MSVLIPAYKPGPGLVSLVEEIRTARPSLPVLVVDDGSGPAYAETFAAAVDAGAVVVSFADNRGKGAALRSGFAYLELNQLLRASREGLGFAAVPIETVYIDDNSSSHFRPVADSVRIYLPLLGFAMTSLGAFLIDTVLLLALTAAGGSLLGSVIGARLASGTFNFTANRRLLTQGGRARPLGGALARYIALAASILSANYALLAGLHSVGLPLLVAKIATELALFAASYLAQKHLVFTPASAPALASPKPRINSGSSL